MQFSKNIAVQVRVYITVVPEKDSTEASHMNDMMRWMTRVPVEILWNRSRWDPREARTVRLLDVVVD